MSWLLPCRTRYHLSLFSLRSIFLVLVSIAYLDVYILSYTIEVSLELPQTGFLRGNHAWDATHQFPPRMGSRSLDCLTTMVTRRYAQSAQLRVGLMCYSLALVGALRPNS